jgi:hypothetical protein
MRKLVTILCIILLSSCVDGKSNKETNANDEDFTVDSTSVVLEPEISDESGVEVDFGNSTDFNEIIPKELDDAYLNLEEKPLLRSDMEGIRYFSKYFNGKDNFGLRLPAFGGIKLGKKEETRDMYFLETKIVKEANNRERVYVIGYSVHIHKKKFDSKIDYNNLSGIAYNVTLNNNRNKVYYSFQTYGMSGAKLNEKASPSLNNLLDTDGLAKLQKTIDAVHTLLSDAENVANIKFTPTRINFLTKNDLRN